jgi:hypothetical protein
MYSPTYFTVQNGYNPRYGVRSTKATVKSFKYSVEDVWGAAVAAQRVNGEYVKEDQYSYDTDTNERTLTKKRNRDIMMDFLAVPGTITDEDRATGRECRRFLQNDLTFRALKGQLNEFDSSVSRVAAVDDQFDTVQHRLELAVVACLPQSHQRSMVRQSIQDRVRSATGGYVGNIGDKVALTAEIVSAKYSQTYGIFWVTAITQNNQALFFSYKSQLNSATKIELVGTVKAHRDNQTQLNRVKITSQSQV